MKYRGHHVLSIHLHDIKRVCGTSGVLLFLNLKVFFFSVSPLWTQGTFWNKLVRLVYLKVIQEMVLVLRTITMCASICIFDPKVFPEMTCYFHNYNLKQSWLDLFSFLTLLRAFNKITFVNSSVLRRSKNLFIAFFPESSSSIKNYFCIFLFRY